MGGIGQKTWGDRSTEDRMMDASIGHPPPEQRSDEA